ncbi:MAG: hypothetical protein RLZZ501_144 [Pseudomonadota bacterium]
MALCSRKCPNCCNLVTVRIDYDDSTYGCSKLKDQIGRQVVLDLYNKIADEMSSADDDMAVILHVSGADIAARCSHMNRNNENAIELF